jgi:hypothetical protein
MKRLVFGFIAVVLASTATVLGQSSLLAPSRVSDWTQAGVSTGIPTRTTQCATLSPGATASQINSAISGCPAGQVVSLSAGTYSLSSGLVLKSNVTLRGAGPDQTVLSFSGGVGCTLASSYVCFSGGTSMDGSGPNNQANWTGGYAQGTTSITLGANTIGGIKPQVGWLLILDQLVDGTTTSADPFPDVFSCMNAPTCIQNGSSPADGRGSGSSARDQFQIVKVTSISSGACPCTVGISPSIRMPNWRSANSPQAWWSNSAPVTGAGLEDLRVTQVSGSFYAIGFRFATDSWMRDVQVDANPSLGLPRLVQVWSSQGITIRDSYLFDTDCSASGACGSADNYGISYYVTSDVLTENNIIQHVRAPNLAEQSNGNVFGYNYVVNNIADGGWNYSSGFDNHNGGASYWLMEGNDAFGMQMENYHGNAQFTTAFRNYFPGTSPTANIQTVPIFLYAYSRFGNLLGNVLGTVGYHNHYQEIANDANSSAYCETAIYAIGLGDNCKHGDGASYPRDDSHTPETLLRWGNWDAVNGSAQWNAGEIPSGLAKYANPVPSTQTLPASLYLPSKPAFFGTTHWPAIGPDVSGGDVANVAGHVYKIPARQCFENVMHGTFGDTSPRTFNAGTCYGTTTTAKPPTAPTNVRIIPAALLLLPVSLPLMFRRQREGNQEID